MQTALRLFRRAQYSLHSLLNTNSSHSRYFVLGMIALSIFLFAFLHTLFGMVVSKDGYGQQSGYLDLYLENLSKCWGGARYSDAVERKWATPLVPAACGSKAAVPLAANASTSIRLDERHVVDDNCTVVDAGWCYPVKQGFLSILRGQHDVQCLPSFVIAGAMKSGTGELMKWLAYHPFLQLGQGQGRGGSKGGREMHFFTGQSNAFHAPQYASLFPELSEQRAAVTYTFEKSPDYIRHAAALQAMRAMLPSVKVVVILRSPVVRAVSEFLHHCRHGRYVKILRQLGPWKQGRVLRHDVSPTLVGESSDRGYEINLHDAPTGSFEVLRRPCTAEDAVAYLSKGVAGAPFRSNTQQSNGSEPYPSEIANGMYFQQIQQLYQIFPRGQVLVLLQEEMFRNTFRCLRKVESFLGLPCFDYSTKAVLSNAADVPPRRKPDSWADKFVDYGDHLKAVFGLSGDGLGGDDLLRMASPSFKLWMQSIYRKDVASLRDLLRRVCEDEGDSQCPSQEVLSTWESW